MEQTPTTMISSTSATRSPSRKPTTSLLQRQVARALELIELMDENSNAQANGRINSPIVKKNLKTAFAIAPNTMKRKRSTSMNGLEHVAAVVHVDTIVHSPTRKKRTVMKKGGVTPSKRCGNKMKKTKGDTIELALKKFHAEKAKTERGFAFDCHCGIEGDGSNRLAFHVGVSLAQGARAYMEDRFTVTTNVFSDDKMVHASRSPKIVAIYDGHNGAMAAEYASKRFREVLSQSEVLLEVCQRDQLTENDLDAIRSLLCDMFVDTDDEILRMTMQKNKRDGTTVLFGLIVGGKMFIANAGDSRAVLGRAMEDDVVRLSVDHKPDTDIETKRIEDAGGKVIYSGCWRVAHDDVPLRLAISRSLGDHPLKVNLPPSCSDALVSAIPDIHVLDLNQDQDLLVFASDGLWDRFSDQEAIEFARQKILEFNGNHAAHCFRPDFVSKEAARYAASQLVEAALKKRTMDNVTIMVMGWSHDASDDEEEFVHVTWNQDEQSIEI